VCGRMPPSSPGGANSGLLQSGLSLSRTSSLYQRTEIAREILSGIFCFGTCSIISAILKRIPFHPIIRSGFFRGESAPKKIRTTALHLPSARNAHHVQIDSRAHHTHGIVESTKFFFLRIRRICHSSTRPPVTFQKYHHAKRMPQPGSRSFALELRAPKALTP